MRVLDFATYLFYRYYNKGSTAIIAYESALIAISALIFMNVLALMLFLQIDTEKTLPIIDDKGRLIRLLSGFLLVIPQYIILRLLLPRDKIINLSYSKNAIRFGNIAIIFYILLSMALIVIGSRS